MGLPRLLPVWELHPVALTSCRTMERKGRRGEGARSAGQLQYSMQTSYGTKTHTGIGR